MGIEATAGIRPALASADAARLLGVSQTTIVNWLESGALEGYSVAGAARRRHFVFADSAARLQSGVDAPARPSPPDADVIRERDTLRVRLAQAEAANAFLREAFDQVLAAQEDQARANERLRRAVAIQQRAIETYAVDETELT